MVKMLFNNLFVRNLSLICAALFCCVLHVQSQDVLITKGGDVMTVYDVDVSNASVFYRLENNEQSSIKKMDKAEIFMIKRPDGSKLTFDEASAAAPASSDAAVPAQLATASGGISNPDVERNRQLITEINTAKADLIDDEQSDKTAYWSFVNLHVDENSVLANEDVEMSLMTENVYWGGGSLYVTLKNKTNKMIYLDLGNSFFIRGEESIPYYKPTSTASSSGGSTGGALNLGGVANALGVGGALGSIASGMTVGGKKDKSTTTVTYAQRIIALPPQSSKKLDTYSFRSEGLSLGLSSEMKKGETRIFKKGDLPCKWGVYITYSFDESMSVTDNLSASLYVGKIIGYGTFWANRKREPSKRIKFDDNILSFVWSGTITK